MPAARAALWHIRKGLYTAVAGARPSGHDRAAGGHRRSGRPAPAHLPRRSPGCSTGTGTPSSVIFGHAKDGNIHFLLNEHFDRPELVQRYLAFTDDMVDLVLGHGGTLKAEHGTGRDHGAVRPPAVRRRALRRHARGQAAARPATGCSTPGVLLNEDPAAHISHLKSTPTVEPEVDRCVECGYCEPVCPSKDLTTTPRQRIVLRREIAARPRGPATSALLARLEQRVPVRRHRHLRRRRHVPDRLPRAHQHRRPDPPPARRTARPRRAAGLGERPPGTGTAPPASAGAALTAARAVPAPLVGRGHRRRPRCCWAPTRAGLVARPARRRQSPAPTTTGRRRRRRSTSPPASRPCSARRTGTGGPRGLPRALRPGRCRGAGSRGASPRCAAARRGSPRDCRTATTPCASTSVPALRRGHSGRRTARSSWTLRPAPRACNELLTEDARYRASWTPSTFVDSTVLRRLPYRAPRDPRSRPAPHLLVDAARHQSGPAPGRRCGRRARRRPPDDWGCCAFAGDRGMLHPELTASATAAEAAGRRAQRDRSRPTRRSTAPANSA